MKVKSFNYYVVILLFLTFNFTFAQRTISGNVSDEEGVPLPGVNVVIKGTDTGTSTDFDGNYSISVSDSDVITFSYVGFIDQEIEVANAESFDISLEMGSDELEEIVLTGYGSVKKRDLTGAIAQIKTEVIQRANPIQAAASLQGQVAGVLVTRAKGRPGDDLDINIRGLNNFDDEKTRPLVVVDGIMGANINDINPGDIQTIDVLKDASSTAVYGARGANGVIIVTTKKGATGKPSVSYNGYYGIKTKAHIPDMLTSKEFYELYQDEDRYGRGFTAQEMYNVNNGITTDFIDLVTRDAIQQNHNFSVSGGSESTTYNFSAGKQLEEGLVQHADYGRLTLNAGIESSVSDKFKVGFTAYITQNERNWGSTEAVRSALRARPTGTPFFDDIVEPNKRDTNFGPVGDLAFYMGINDSQVINPLVETDPDNFQRQRKSNSMIANAYFEYEIIPGLKFKTSYSAYTDNYREGQYAGTYTKTRKGSRSPVASTAQNKTSNYTVDNTLNYNKEFGKHSIDATALFSVFEEYNESMNIGVEDLPYKSLWHSLGTGATVTSYGSNLNEYSIVSYMGRINYGFDGKYLLTITGRQDGASQLADGNKWAFFPSAAIGWRMSEESFVKGLGVFDNLKLRASYGEVGNNASISPYATQSNIFQTFYDFDGNPSLGYTINSLANQGVVWERSKELNFGLDFSLSGIRLSGTVEYYKRNTEDLILDDKVPNSTGFNNVLDNVGEIENSGIEVSLNSVNVSKGDFKWSSNLTFTANDDKVVKLAGGITEDIGNARFVGESVKAYYTYKFEGIWQLGQEAEAAEFGQVPGQIRIRDLNGDKKINSDDRMIVGKGTPDWTAGLRNQFNYKNWDMSFFVYTRRGQMYSNAFLNGTYGDIASDRYNRSADLDYWTPDNPSNTYYNPVTGPGLNSKNERKGGTSRVGLSYQLADFVRISDITMGYSLPNDILSELGVSRFRFYGQLQNPFIFSDFLSFDPEYNSGGNDDDLPALTVLFGVNINF
ncbi:MAG: SusC/RagA family TonB-linked outer membrane protein [Flavobacteriaceae bacterium]|nr:SusC/RagA family TonB-linked outer membrane protein [Flavobacteriaceae bacterium]